MLKKAMLESEAGIIAVETNTIAVGGDEKEEASLKQET
jgi:hypothetical protein